MKQRGQAAHSMGRAYGYRPTQEIDQVMKRRVYAVLDIEGEELNQLDLEDIATWIDASLRPTERRRFEPSVVYDSIEDMLADKQEAAGAFAAGWNE